MSMGGTRNIGAIIADEFRDDFVEKAFDDLKERERLLDLGCGSRPFRRVYDNLVAYSVGVDVPFSPHELGDVQVYAYGTSLPFCDASFNVVLCTEVMEHVPEPEKLLREVNRVLRPGGLLILTTPFLVPLHEPPYDFYRYTLYGLKYLCDKAGLSVQHINPFAEMTGVVIFFLVQTQLKFWYALSRGTKLSVIYSLYNPFIFLLVYLPQKIYVRMSRWCLKTRALRALYERMAYTTIGYGLIATKP
jgi:SAM-dependent methyltransferase